MDLFKGEDYDIFTDKIKRYVPKDRRILEEIYLAYCKTLEVRRLFGLTKLGNQLDLIHDTLIKRIKELEPNEPASNDRP